MIEVRELQKSFGATAAVGGLSFDVRDGETFGLLGPNGAGKSTTIGMLTGAIRPDGGSIRINGSQSPTEASTRMAIGFAPQDLSLYEELSAIENLTFFGRLYQLAGNELRERVAWALEFAGLADRQKDRVKTFSGGMKRRLNLAVALVHDPSVIFLDEPTAGVDPQSRNHIFERIEELRSQGRTVIYTTHYMEEAQRLCDRVAIMDGGKVLDLDTVPALIDRYGGRSVVKAEFARRPADSVVLPAPLDGLSLRFESDRPLEEVGRLSSAGVAFQSLEVTRPDLETVFLTLTGRSLRD
jgi:ABC-2 type transport system ATP-binding protein